MIFKEGTTLIKHDFKEGSRSFLIITFHSRRKLNLSQKANIEWKITRLIQ